VVSILAFHAGYPGSSPGIGNLLNIKSMAIVTLQTN
jgi:hypothetical protein